MTVKIVTPGKKTFHAHCHNCGCEFTYELSDLIGTKVFCPTCARSVYHPGVKESKTRRSW